MRTLTRSILAATSVAGLLALPVVSAGAAADTNIVNMDIVESAEAVTITVPPNDTGLDFIDIGSVNAGANPLNQNVGSLGDITVADTSTGLIRESTVTVASELGAVGFCQDADDVVSAGVECSPAANTSIAASDVLYTWGAVSATGPGSTGVVPAGVPGALDAATTLLEFVAVTPGSYELTWNPTFGVTLDGTEAAGEYYGEITHTVTGQTVGL